MKKAVCSFILIFMTTVMMKAQCVPSCSNYIVSPLTFTTYSGLGGGTGYGANEQLLGDDQVSAPCNIGFTFTFMCVPYTQFAISSNGFITFDLVSLNNGCCAGMVMPNIGTPYNLVALFWNDMYPPGGGTITYATTGVSPNQRCVITYTNIPHFGLGATPCSGQIVLHEGTNIIDIYSGDVSNDGSICTQGIENTGATLAFPAPLRNGTNWTTLGTAYRWVPAGAPAPPVAIIGNTTACIGEQQNFSILASPGASAYVWTLPGGWTGSSTTTAITTTVGASGTISVSASYTCGLSVATVLNFSTISAPVVSISSASPNLICTGNTSTISVAGAIAYTLEPGNNTNGPPFVVNPMATTIYTLYGINSSNCTSVNDPTMTVYVNESPTVTINSGAICLGQSFNFVPTGASTYSISSGFFAVTPLTAGITNYTVVGTGTNGCVSNAAIASLTTNALPNIIAAATRTDICKDESTIITASGANTYSWSTTATGPVITVSPLTTTVYIVTGIGAGGCTNSYTVNLKVSHCVGLNENSNAVKSFVSLYPNPSSGEFTIKTKATTSVMIYDMQGKLIFNQKINEGTQIINLSQFASGEYLLNASQGDALQSFTIIKE